MGTVRRERSEYMTAAQCRLLRVKGHEMDKRSIALAQAFEFELRLRQKDGLGECLPSEWSGFTDVIDGPRKWLFGLQSQESPR
jgi:hypothetical protein